MGRDRRRTRRTPRPARAAPRASSRRAGGVGQLVGHDDVPPLAAQRAPRLGTTTIRSAPAGRSRLDGAVGGGGDPVQLTLVAAEQARRVLVAVGDDPDRGSAAPPGRRRPACRRSPSRHLARRGGVSGAESEPKASRRANGRAADPQPVEVPRLGPFVGTRSGCEVHRRPAWPSGRAPPRSGPG